jgi:hypothetical protein
LIGETTLKTPEAMVAEGVFCRCKTKKKMKNYFIKGTYPVLLVEDIETICGREEFGIWSL